jgi:hypothetical protein
MPAWKENEETVCILSKKIIYTSIIVVSLHD